MASLQANGEGKKEYAGPLRRSPVIALTLILLLLVAGLAPCLCAAQQTPSPSAPTSANNTTRGPQDVTELASFLNTTINDELDGYHIPGATVAVVKDGKLFYAKGYGYADLENKTPVDANATLFEIGSTGKLFTWTAVMQLVEEGKIDLHADVNTYLKDFKIPETYPEPITMEHLMTHASGFETQPAAIAVSDPKDIKPLGTTLAQTIPGRIWPPGQVWSYSNWGSALAGYIVQEVSGVPYNHYVQEKFFTPLGMNNTTIEQPVPPPLAANVSKTYAYSDGAFQQTEEWTIGIPPVGGEHSTASDVAKFMIAHLNNGEYNGTRILNTSTAQDMHSAHFTPDPYTKFGLGFFMGNQNNESCISHTGDAEYFRTAILLWPERNVGLFVSYNSAPGALARADLVQQFLDHYYPYTPTPPQHANFNDAQLLTGTYQSIRNVYTTVKKYFGADAIGLQGGPTFSVTGYANGTLTFSGVPGNLVEVAPLVFASPDGNTTVGGGYHSIFTTGNGTYFHSDAHSVAVPQYYERLPWYATPEDITYLGYLCLAVFASVAIWPLGDLYGRWRRRRHAESTTEGEHTRLPSLAHWLMGITGVLCWLVFLIPFLLLFALGHVQFEYLTSSITIPLPIIAWLTVPLIAIALTAGGIVLAVLAWRRRYWNTFGRIHYTVVTGAALAFIIWLNYWNMIGFKW
ncbi:MAG: beta-lactamase family protein [Euryarchaeota archaeon]|nr:beta-lactamase family protein [Euryarchaeota archaeon]